MSSAQAPILECRSWSKTFGGVHALSRVDLTVKPGEVHGLLGQNGSGKSTLIKVLCGYHAPDPGAALFLRGRQVALPLRAGRFTDLGMAFVHQDLGLVGDLSVLENLLIVDLAAHSDWHVDWRAKRRYVRESLSRFGLRLEPETLVRDLPDAQRALLAIVRAVDELRVGNGRDRETSATGRLLVLDEPTVFLGEGERATLGEIMREVVEATGAVLFVSHDLDEVLQFTDQVTVLRDGRLVATEATEHLTKDELVTLITGPRRPETPPATNLVSGHARAVGKVDRTDPAVLEVRDASGGQTGVRGLAFELRRGEILGITGLGGTGFEDVPYLIFGATRALTGSVGVNGRSVDLTTLRPRDAMKAGMALIPGNRQADGAVMELTIRENLSLDVLGAYQPWRLRRRRLRADCDRVLQDAGVRCDPAAAFRSLSGGNQQRVVLAKWLWTRPRIFLLHEPTAGVDVGARREIFARLRTEATGGMSVVCASSDHEQLAAICDRVLIMGGGHIVSELQGHEITKEAITSGCLAT